MKDLREIQHDLRRDIHNMMSLLKFIDEENSSSSELKEMIQLCFSREKNTLQNLELLSGFVTAKKEGSHEKL